jgi:hypothetical protein
MRIDLSSIHGSNKVFPTTFNVLAPRKPGTKFDVCSIFKPNAPLAKVVKDLEEFGKDLTKQDHFVIVGGPENSLD